MRNNIGLSVGMGKRRGVPGMIQGLHGIGRIGLPIGSDSRLIQSAIRFESNKTQALGRVISSCAYCSDTFSKKRPPTFDHIRPDSARGSDHTENGVLACQPCNGRRGNVPLLEFLDGEEGGYRYRNGGNIAEKQYSSSRIPTPQEIETRQAAFSDYLRRFVETRAKAPPSNPNPWFSQALDNLLFPTWKQGTRPKDPALIEKLFQRRVKAFVKILARSDADFWLGSRFEQIVKETFQAQPRHQAALLQAIRELRPATSEKIIPLQSLSTVLSGFNPFAWPLSGKMAVSA